MLAKAALFLLSALWVLLCMRFYTVIDRENVMQRRLIAIGAGLGAGLIYVLGSMIITLLNTPLPSEQQQEMNQAQDVRVLGK
ncbi:hypothetical protein EI77_03620 [Prosthecobacter fusiformis]|uniref:Uncharacterized protein n=1 Tax=Prosthecobacter fusiformis TaxID=48464 RepID=A0A4R7RP47_9BACT|nr:hypothetical protein [Prosthecobacter fusiformis]TDU66525.1 hypothetical protein EI77_03620 [Prosthecobacter fusiformis]